MTNNSFPPDPDAKPMPAAELQVPSTGSPAVVNQSFPVRVSEADVNEFYVRVRASILRKSRAKLERAIVPKFPWHEVNLGVSTLLLGAAVGAIPAKLPFPSFMAILFYTLMPAAGIGTAVAFLLLRRNSDRELSAHCEEALSEIPDPDKSREVC